MKVAASKKPTIQIAVVESDPLRFIGLKSLFDTEQDLELFACSLAELGPRRDVDLVLLGTRAGQNLFDVMAGLKAARPDLRIIVTGSGADDETILKALAAGAKGYVDEAASPAEFIQAMRNVNQGSVWAPRRVLSTDCTRVLKTTRSILPILSALSQGPADDGADRDRRATARRRAFCGLDGRVPLTGCNARGVTRTRGRLDTLVRVDPGGCGAGVTRGRSRGACIRHAPFSESSRHVARIWGVGLRSAQRPEHSREQPCQCDRAFQCPSRHGFALDEREP